MNEDLTQEQKAEKVRLTTNIVGETKKEILSEPEKKKKDDTTVSDDELMKAIERINPDPNSLKSWG